MKRRVERTAWASCGGPSLADRSISASSCEPSGTLPCQESSSFWSWEVAKEWDTPWYLLTNEPLWRVQEALRIVQIYSRRGPIEGRFRFEKSELGSEHLRVREWEAHLKFLAMVTLVSAFWLSLLQEEGALVRIWVLERWDHQTGERARQSVQPLYRVRRALSRLWQAFRPRLLDRPAWLLAGFSPRTPNFCSQSSG
jgi:hypothetical protein